MLYAWVTTAIVKKKKDSYIINKPAKYTDHSSSSEANGSSTSQEIRHILRNP